jgi:hypothetical protein
MDQWQQIEDVYHAALERELQNRASFLDEACGGDETLRKEIESLLLQEPEAVDFLETPAQWQSLHPPTRQRVFHVLTSKLALQLAMMPPLVIIVWTIVKNPNRTIGDLVRTNAGYFYWLAAAALVLQFRDKVRIWFDRNFLPEE